MVYCALLLRRIDDSAAIIISKVNQTDKENKKTFMKEIEDNNHRYIYIFEKKIEGDIN